MRHPSKSLGSRVAVAAAAAQAAGGAADSPAAHKSGVVIVGGGPAGYASAMMLARRGWTDITLVEAQADPTYADPDRSYGE
jgi:NADPH-dependent 2,4-dienoyl-CoA reductase/sulfur reductase-like enzyme